MKRLLLPMAAVLVAATARAAADPFLGAWVLDTQRSRYAPGTCPKGMTIEMTAAGRGVHYHSETEMQNGTSFAADYTAQYDGTPSLVTGARGILLPVSLQRPGPRMVVAKYMSGMEVRATSRRTVSPDGQTMTVSTTSGDGFGGSFTNVGVYHRMKNSPALKRLLSQTRIDLNSK